MEEISPAFSRGKGNLCQSHVSISCTTRNAVPAPEENNSRASKRTCAGSCTSDSSELFGASHAMPSSTTIPVSVVVEDTEDIVKIYLKNLEHFLRNLHS